MKMWADDVTFQKFSCLFDLKNHEMMIYMSMYLYNSSFRIRDKVHI